MPVPGGDRIDEPDVRTALEGDTRAFERLYRRHAAAIYGLAVRFHGQAEAEWLTQDVFVRAWQKLATFRGESRFGTWLHRLAVNVFVTHFRRRGREAERGSDDNVGEITVEEHADLRLDLEHAIGRLPARARAVFVLHDLERHSHEETASLLGISVGTSKSQLHRARNLLSAYLEESDGRSVD